jgi:hypothetical protein
MESREMINSNGNYLIKAIYLVERCAEDHISWDEYSAFVCVADSKQDAISLKSITVDPKYGPKTLIVTEIGLTNKYKTSQVILASFHAG